jgi:hypothetical protein
MAVQQALRPRRKTEARGIASPTAGAHDETLQEKRERERLEADLAQGAAEDQKATSATQQGSEESDLTSAEGGKP